MLGGIVEAGILGSSRSHVCRRIFAGDSGEVGGNLGARAFRTRSVRQPYPTSPDRTPDEANTNRLVPHGPRRYAEWPVYFRRSWLHKPEKISFYTSQLGIITNVPLKDSNFLATV